MDVTADVPVKDSYSKVAYLLQSMYPCLGVTCADIGGLKGDGGTYFPGLQPCDDAQVSRSFTPPSAPCTLGTTASVTDPRLREPNAVGNVQVAAAFLSSELMLTVVLASSVALVM